MDIKGATEGNAAAGAGQGIPSAENKKVYLLPIKKFEQADFHPLRANLIARLLKVDVSSTVWWTHWYTSGGIAGLSPQVFESTEWKGSKTMPLHVRKVLVQSILELIQQRPKAGETTIDPTLQLRAAQFTQCAKDWNCLSVLNAAFNTWCEEYCSTTARLLVWLIIL